MKTCKKCNGECKPSKALLNQLVSFDDFGNDAGNIGSTQSRVGEAKLVDTMKCSLCGHSFIPDDEKTTLKELMLKFTEEWNRRNGQVTIEFSTSEINVPLFLELAKEIIPEHKGEWVCDYCKTCKEHNEDTPIHCSIEDNYFGALNAIKKQSKYYEN